MSVDWFNSQQVIHMTGLSYRQLDYNIRSGAFGCMTPKSGSGTSRMFSRPQVEHIRITAMLMERFPRADVSKCAEYARTAQEVTGLPVMPNDGSTIMRMEMKGWLIELRVPPFGEEALPKDQKPRRMRSSPANESKGKFYGRTDHFVDTEARSPGASSAYERQLRRAMFGEDMADFDPTAPTSKELT